MARRFDCSYNGRFAADRSLLFSCISDFRPHQLEAAGNYRRRPTDGLLGVDDLDKRSELRNNYIQRQDLQSRSLHRPPNFNRKSYLEIFVGHFIQKVCPTSV